MLKEWFSGKKTRYHDHPRRHFHRRRDIFLTHHQHPVFSDGYTVRRKNPLFAEENSVTNRVYRLPPTSNRIIPDELPKLHVQTWCSTVCPRHMTTCCVCKPVFIYCDHCAISKSPERKKPRKFHQSSTSIKYPNENTTSVNGTMASESPLGTGSQNLARIGNDVQHDRLQLETSANDYPIYEQLIPQEELLATEGFQITNEEQSTQQQQQHPVQFYVNSNFVNGITLLKNVETFPSQKPSVGEITFKSLQQKVYKHGQRDSEIDPSNKPPNVETRRMSQESTDSAEVDSLESMRIDEGMFTPEFADAAQSHSHSPKITNNSSHHVHRAKKNDEVPYETMKDLYEKLANNKHHVALSQAMMSKLPSDYHVTYGTVSMSNTNKRKSYADLLHEEAKRTNTLPSTYYDNILLRSAPILPNTLGRSVADITASRHPRIMDSQAPNGNDQLHQVNSNGKSSATSNTSSTVEYSREQNVGHQLTQVTRDETTFMEKLLNQLQKRNCRDACKIIVTTIIGLTAFGIITALSLRLQQKKV